MWQNGITEHILGYEKAAEYFTERGILVVGNDHLGHGTSIREKEEFMYCGNWDDLVEDVRSLQDISVLC